MKKFFLMLLAIVGLTMQANAITLTVVSGDKNDPNNNEGPNGATVSARARASTWC